MVICVISLYQFLLLDACPGEQRHVPLAMLRTGHSSTCESVESSASSWVWEKMVLCWGRETLKGECLGPDGRAEHPVQAPTRSGTSCLVFLLSVISLDFLCFPLSLPLRGFLNPRKIWAHQGPRPFSQNKWQGWEQSLWILGKSWRNGERKTSS